MSVASKNPFALLSDDPSEQAAPQPKKEAPAPAPTQQNQKPRSSASRGGKYYQRGGKPREAGAGAAEETAGEDGAKRKFDGEGRGRGRGRGRGDRGGRGRGGRGGGERLDRHSATGKTDTEKKVSQGWGANEGSAELKAEESGAADAANDWGTPAAAEDAWATPAAAAAEGADPWATNGATPAEGAESAAEGDKEGGERRRREREPEEEDNTVSYEQYLAQKKDAEGFDTPLLETRQANEGDESWQKSVQALKKSEDEEAYFVGKTKSAPKARTKKEEKVFIEIDARFERPSRGGRGRGGDRGRGEGRGRGRGRGGPPSARAPRTNGPALSVDDETAFPSLS